MENKGIGIYKQIICNGSELHCDGNGLLKDKVEDLRDRSYNQKIKNVGYSPFLLLTLYPEGFMVTVMKFLDERVNDYAAGWIFVPNNLGISGTKLKRIVDQVEGMLSDKFDVPKIQKITGVSYQTKDKDSVPSYKPSSGSRDAVRYYKSESQYSLEVILNDPFQKEYAEYRSVILLDSSTNMKYDEAEDLTKQQIKKSAILSFPNSNDTYGFTPYIDGKEKQWYPCYVGDPILVVWKKTGYVDIPKKEDIGSSEQLATLPNMNEIRRKIPLNTIHVYDNDDKSKEIKDFKVEYKGKPCSNEFIEVLESGYKSAGIIIKAEDYEEKSILIEKACSGNVYLDPKSVEYSISLRDKNGSCINFEIHTKGNTLKQILHEGTHLAIENDLVKSPNNWQILDKKNPNEERSREVKQHGQQETSPENKHSLKELLISLLLGLILGFVIGQMIPRSSGEPQRDSGTAVAGTDSVNTLTRQDSIHMMVSYLDKNKVWKKDSFENYSFEDLYNAMVHYKFNMIRSKGEQLSKSEQFKKLLEVIPTTAEDKNKFSGKSYKNDPSEINVDSYIKKIKEIKEQPKPTEKPASDQSKGTTPSPKKKDSKVESKVPKKSTSSNPTTKSGMTDAGR
ncbi:MAG: hypothetical protein LKF06_03005 [Prevotella sp.]|nr:hypothetical protein [Prevotella sp.]MCI1324596.1 hypothetical protein [Prevotella sp.]